MHRDLQHETMRVYQALVDLREDWGGGLVLCCGPGCAHTGGPTAVSIAGGVTLAIDSDGAAMKSAMRAGYLDFVVNSLDEALRTLKNEIRQRRPLGVGLMVDMNAALTEMVERGVQPDLQLVYSGSSDLCSADLETLRVRGMAYAVLPMLNLFGQSCCEYFFPASDAGALREIDTALLAALPAEDVVFRRWLERVPKYLREARSGGRWTWLSDEELEGLERQGLSPARRT
jgi:urocanate hydratase